MQGLALSLLETVIVAPRNIQGDENIPRSLKTMCDALDFLDEPDAITFVALDLVVFQRFQLGLHHGAALSPDDGIDCPAVALHEVGSLHVHFH